MHKISRSSVAVAAALAIGATIVLVAGPGAVAQSGQGQWTQFGGPGQTFKSASKGLTTTWSETGPKKVWSRDLGDGYSGILIEGNRLYTMYRTADGEEAVVCMDAASGETAWEYKYDSSPAEGHVTQFGEGPRSTPLIVGDRIYTIGIAGVMHSLKKTDGTVVWSHDLWKEYGGNHLNHGYSSSPIEYKNTIIALVGGEGASIVAFDKKSGDVVWKAHDFENSYSTPTVLKVGGKDQLVAFMGTEIVGLDPKNGDLKWSYGFENQWHQNINMPVMIDDLTVFASSPQVGAKGLKLVPKEDGTFDVEEAWATRKIQFYHVTSIKDGDVVYGSTGTQAPCFMAAINVRTGEVLWRERGFAKANTIEADGKLIILDENGELAIATATPDGLTVHAQASMLERVAWTVPTIVGKTVYLRDKNTIMALDLG